MRLELYNEKWVLTRIIRNIIDMKLINDEYFIDCEEDGITIKYHFNCKKAVIKEVHIIYE